MVDKSIFKLALYLSWKCFYSVYSIIGYSLFAIPLIAVYYGGSPELSLQLFIKLSPYLFLLSSRDLLYSDIDKNVLENNWFINGKYKKYLVYKVMSTILLDVLLMVLCFIIYALSGAITIYTLSTIQSIVTGMFVGIYLALLGSYLSYYIKGISNVLIIIVVQVAIIVVPMAIGIDRLYWVFELIQTGKTTGIMSVIIFQILLAIYPTIVMKSALLSYTPVIIAYIIVMMILHRIKARQLEIPRQ